MANSDSSDIPVIKRGRGRPRKIRSDDEPVKPKRPVGRPRKVKPEPIEEKPKGKKPGRPRKYDPSEKRPRKEYFKELYEKQKDARCLRAKINYYKRKLATDDLEVIQAYLNEKNKII